MRGTATGTMRFRNVLLLDAEIPGGEVGAVVVRFFLVAASVTFAIAMTGVLGGCGPSDPEPPAAFLDVLTGTTHVLPAGEASFVTAADGRSLDQGDRIRTVAGARAAVVFFEGSVVLLDGGADVTLELLQGSRRSGESEIGMFQSMGRTVHRVTKLVDAESVYSLRTSSAIALVRGTGFIVEEDPVAGTKLKTFQGRVGVAGATGVEVVVDEGRSTEVSRGQDPTTPIVEPLLPEEQDLVDVTENVIEANQVRPPPMKDPDISTPVPEPTPTLAPVQQPPPAPAAIPTPTPAPVAQPTPTPGSGGGEPATTPAPASAPVGPSPAGETPGPQPASPVPEAPQPATPAPVMPGEAAPTPLPEAPSEPTATPGFPAGETPAPPTPAPTPQPATPQPATPVPPKVTPAPQPTDTPTTAPTVTPSPVPTPTLTPTPTETPTPTLIPDPPIALILSPEGSITVVPGTIINISGSCSAAEGLSISEMRWTYGGQHISGEAEFTWLVSQSGTLSLTCTDSAGQVSGTVPRVIGIAAPTPTPTLIPTVAPTDPPPPEGVLIHIQGIDTGFDHFSANSYVFFLVNIQDQEGGPAAGVSVVGQVSGPLGTFPVSGVSAANSRAGGIVVAELRHNTTSFGTYTLNITSVLGDGMTHDAGASVTLSASVTLE